jgi:hypothetical protein
MRFPDLRLSFRLRSDTASLVDEQKGIFRPCLLEEISGSSLVTNPLSDL